MRTRGIGVGSQVVDGVIVGVQAAGGLGDGEDADQPGEEEEDSAEGEEEAEAIGDETLAGAVRAVGTVVPVIVVASSAGALLVATVGRTATVASVILTGAAGTAFEIGGRDDGGHPDHSTRAMSRDYSDWAAVTTVGKIIVVARWMGRDWRRCCCGGPEAEA